MTDRPPLMPRLPAVKVIEAQPCESVQEFARRLLVISWFMPLRLPTVGILNSATMVVKPGMLAEDVILQWYKQKEPPG